MEDFVQNTQIVPEKALQDITKGPLVQFTLKCDDNDKVDRVWQSLLMTVSAPGLSHYHTASACNAASAFIDASVNSENPETKKLGQSSLVWQALFDVFMTRFEDVKPKPLKQVLGSLAAILAKHHEGEIREASHIAVIDSILPSIVLGEPRSRLKGSLVCLELFIRKSAILPSELIPLVQRWLSKNKSKWIPLFEKDRHTLFPDTACPETIVMHDDPSEELAARVFFLGLLDQTSNRAMAGTSGMMLATFLRRLKSQSPNTKLSSLWVSPMRHVLLKKLDSLDILSVQLLTPLFTADPPGFIAFIESLPLINLSTGNMSGAEQSEYMLLFASLEVGKKANLVHEDYLPSKEEKGGEGVSHEVLLRSEVIGNFLLHNDSHIRVAALSLLVTAFSTVKPLTTAATAAILRGLPSMHADSDTYSRGEIMSLTRKLIIRLKGGILIDQDLQEETKEATGNHDAQSPRNAIATKAFLRSYIKFLQDDLCVTASYQRHITGLKALKLLLDSGLDPRADITPAKSEVETRWKLQVEVFNAPLLRLLVDLLLDPFEEVRQLALSIINMFPPALVLLSGERNEHSALGLRLADALARAESLASKTSRADHADTVARLYHILFCAALPQHSLEESADWWTTKSSVVNTLLTRLEKRLSSPKGLFSGAMREAPLHGYMSGLRYIVLTPNFHSYISITPDASAWRSVHDRIVAVCNKVWQEVRPVLCIDSPEGHSDEPVEELSVGPKDLLSYSWRALRESSLLLHGTLSNITYGPSGEDGLQWTDFEKIGKSSFTQLAELRHRGAFSTVTQTFTACCQRCNESTNPALQGLPLSWYREAIATIFQSASKLTRRSAGLPAMITGILSSSPGTQFLKQAINELHEISRLTVAYNKDRQYLELPQVHAMNCLKDIFTDTKLGHRTEPFIMPALTLSAERLGSPIWALRNSGLMLFRALLTRMCRLVPETGVGFGGISGSEPGSKISFPKYPGLLDLLSQLLTPIDDELTTPERSEIITERVFPALELIGQKIPTFEDNKDKALRNLVLQHLSSPVWGIREHAARVYASLLTRGNILHDVRDLVSLLKMESNQNFIHGIILCVRYSLRRFAATPDFFWVSHIDELLITIRHALAEAFALAKSPFVATALIEILNDALERSVAANVERHVTSLISDIYKENSLDAVFDYVYDDSHTGWNVASNTRASSLLRRAVAWCTLLQMFALPKWDTISDSYHAVSQSDADVGSWLADKLQETLGENDKYRGPLLHLYTSTLLGDHPSIVKSKAASNISSVLEAILFTQGPHALSNLSLPCDDLRKSFRPEMNTQEWNREATDAALRLQGCLLANQVSKVGQASLHAAAPEIQNWAIKLRSALDEETDFTTRHAAASSLKSFARGLRVDGTPPRVDALLLDVYLVLYDLLNDDDEDLRDMAASTTSLVLSYSSISPNASVALAPLNASALLASFISEHYSDSSKLACQIIEYITGQRRRISSLDASNDLVPVPLLVDQYSRESTVLFVQEKQNLFIDEVREVDVWSKELFQFQKSALSEKVLQQLAYWVSKGLQHFIGYICQDSGRDGFLGWISKPESFTLGVRIISIASVLMSSNFVAPELLGVNQSALREQLEALWKAGKSAAVHDQLLSRIESGLNVLSE